MSTRQTTKSEGFPPCSIHILPHLPFNVERGKKDQVLVLFDIYYLRESEVSNVPGVNLYGKQATSILRQKWKTEALKGSGRDERYWSREMNILIKLLEGDSAISFSIDRSPR